MLSNGVENDFKMVKLFPQSNGFVWGRPHCVVYTGKAGYGKDIVPGLCTSEICSLHIRIDGRRHTEWGESAHDKDDDESDEVDDLQGMRIWSRQ